VRASFFEHIAKVEWETLDNAAHFLYVDQRGWYMELVGVFFWGGGRCLGECECGSGAEAGGAGGFGDGLGCFRIMLLCITLPFLSRVIVLLP